MGMEAVCGDVVMTTELSILMAIDGDPDNTIWIPRKVIEEFVDGELAEGSEGIEILVSSWWYRKNEERFE